MDATTLDSWSWRWFAIVAAGPVALAGYALVLAFASTGGRHGIPAPRSLRVRLVSGLMLLSVIPALGITISLTVREIDRHRARLASDVLGTTAALAADTDDFVSRHVAGVRLAAETLTADATASPARAQEGLRRFHAVFTGFLTTLVTDDLGVIQAATRMSPGGPIEVAAVNHAVADRDYFRVPMADGRAFVSQALRGRGLGTDPIVAISSPFSRHGARAGVVEGSLDLQGFATVALKYVAPDSADEVMIVDEQWRVIFASPRSGLQFLDNLSEDEAYRNLRSARPGTLTPMTRGGRALLAARAPTSRGWTAIMVVPETTLASQLRQDFGVTLGWLAATLACALLLAVALSRNTTEPLDRLRRALETFEVGSGDRELRRVRGLSTEFRAFFRSLHRVSCRLRASHRRVSEALTDANALRGALGDALARREEEVRQRTAELDRANRELERLSRVDALTSLANRRRFDEFLPVAWRAARRDQQSTVIALVDIDYFKRYNDRYGHPAGDACLRRVAAVIGLAAERPLDLAARYGGEEFALVLFGGTTDGAAGLVAAVRAAVVDLSIPHEDSPLGCVTVSIGLAELWSGGGDTSEAALERADQALYTAKREGRNRLAVWAAGASAPVVVSPVVPAAMGRRFGSTQVPDAA